VLNDFEELRRKLCRCARADEEVLDRRTRSALQPWLHDLLQLPANTGIVTLDFSGLQSPHIWTLQPISAGSFVLRISFKLFVTTKGRATVNLAGLNPEMLSYLGTYLSHLT
jgi:hypothetical protein